MAMQMHFHMRILHDRQSCHRRREEECDKMEELSLALKCMAYMFRLELLVVVI